MACSYIVYKYCEDIIMVCMFMKLFGYNLQVYVLIIIIHAVFRLVLRAVN